MPRNSKRSDFGSYIVLNGQRLELEHHPTDFSVLAPSSRVEDIGVMDEVDVQPLAKDMTRIHVKSTASRDEVINTVRQRSVAHHIYRVTNTDEEIVIDNRILLTLRHEDPQELETIIQEYHLVPEGKMGNAHILQITEATGRNPLKTANEIAQREMVASCSPQVLLPIQTFQTSFIDTYRLFRHQWYLSSDLLSNFDLVPTAGIHAPEAWQTTFGSPDIVIAVIDDGFDLEHPAFRNKRIHPAKRDFAVQSQDEDPSSQGQDFHGTCVASIATGSLEGDGMVGVAPGCTFLPIRIGFGPLAPPIDILQVFRYTSRFADVVNCSFGTPPSSIDRFPSDFRQEITTLTRFGGRRGKGLVMVFAAGNDDAPTRLRAADNQNGVHYVDLNAGRTRTIPPGRDVFSGYPLTSGIIVVSAMSSLKRKSGYSNWGPHLTVCAPSNNLHYITRFIRRGVDDAIRNQFLANYRGLGQVAAVNRTGRGNPFEPLPDDPNTLDFSEQFFTITFGGTSGAAPIVTGIVALMISVNPSLTADQVAQILRSTADQDLDPTLDLVNDPNVQGLSGSFVMGRSLFFGSGKVNAQRAVQRAQALLGIGAPLQLTLCRNGTTSSMVAPITSSLQKLRVETFSWNFGEFDGNYVGHWKIGGPHYGEVTHGEARLWIIDRDGKTVAEFQHDSGLSVVEEPSPGTFAIRIAQYPSQVAHPPYYTELILSDLGQHSRNGCSLLLVSMPASVSLPS